MTFLHPEYLWFLTAMPLLGLVLFFSARRGRATITLLVGEHQRDDVLSVLIVKNFLVAILFTVALASLVIAIAGPQWGEVSVEDERRGLDIVFLMDVSNSMRAEDIPPSRLLRSRELAGALARRLPEAHKAVVAFKGAATTLVPMTEDPVSFDLAIANLSGALITTAGTDLRSGLETALDAFPDGSPRRAVIVLFSDGDQLAASVEASLPALQERDVTVLAVTVGTADGATIPRGAGDVLLDSDGNPVIARANRAVMERIADATGGEVVSVLDTNLTTRLVEVLDEVSGAGQSVVFRRAAVDRYPLFVIITLVMVTLIVVIQSVRWKGLV